MKTVLLALTVISAAAAPAVFGQGSLTPPGAPAPTMKTLDQIEARTPLSSIPFAITTSGSYYLTTNLSAGIAQNGFTISADNVTLDLNGFTLTGSSSLNAVLVSGARRNLKVMNGTLRNWADCGILATNGTACTFENLRLLNSGRGLWIGNHNVVRDCVANGNTTGLEGGAGNLVSGCTFSQSGSTGVKLEVGSQVVQSSVISNSFYGIISPSFTGSISINQCVVQGNGSGGISLYNGRVYQSTVSGNLGNGIEINFQGDVRDCTITGNTNCGVSVTSGSIIMNNTVSANGTAGSSTSAGILAGDLTRIEGNTLLGNKTSGIKITGVNNLVIRNASTDSTTNYFFGPGLNTTGTVLGFSVAATNTQPNANIVY